MKDRQHLDKGRYISDRMKVKKKGESIRKCELNLGAGGGAVYRTCFDSQRRGRNEMETPHGAASRWSLDFQMSGKTWPRSQWKNH